MQRSLIKHFIIAIDGVSGSGKSSTAKAVAKQLGILHLDTGAMYRAVAFLALEQRLSPHQSSSIVALLNSLEWQIDDLGGLLVGGRDLSAHIRTDAVNKIVSDYAQIPEVRSILVPIQRQIGMRQSSVVEGRDMATVVFPNAAFKFFMDASPELRAQRRVRELVAMNFPADYEKILENLKERDQKDYGRKYGPLILSQDAQIIDTSELTFAGQVAIIVDRVLKTLSATPSFS